MAQTCQSRDAFHALINVTTSLESEQVTVACALSRQALYENPPVDSDGGKTPQRTFGSSVSSSSTVAPRTNTSHSMKQFDFHGIPSTVTLCKSVSISGRSPLRRDARRRTLTNIACGEKFFVRIVVLVLNSGLKNDTLGKKGEERRKCCVAGTGYNPARWKTTKLPIAPLSVA